MKRSALALAAFLAAACGQRELPPPGELLVHVDTDAPLIVDTAGAIGPTRAQGLFDRMRVEVLDADAKVACSDCRREYVISQRALDEDALTFGVILPSSGSYRMRVRLFPSDAFVGDRPNEAATIDALFALPRHDAEGIREVTARLSFETLGVPADLDAAGKPVEIGRAMRGERAVPSERPTCAAAPRDGEVCVPGGAYWAARALANLANAVEPWRAIVMSPFFLDAHEVTVAELRASKLATASDPRRSPSGALPCTYSDLSGPNDGLPVTCVSVDLARRYCQARGGDLPTMAQLEYVRGALAGQPYVWGFDAPTCDSAIWGRNPDGDITCAALGLGPRPPGSAARDRLRLAGGEIVDLAGNVAELLVDQTSKECRRAGVFRDPRCGAPGGVAAGSYAGDVVELLAPARLLFVSLPDPKVGFRCARPATP